MTRPVKSANICGTRWRVKDNTGLKGDDLAECDYANKTISIPVDGDTLDELDWTLHEALHAGLPFLTEEIVSVMATDAARLLWRLQWRKDA